MKKASVAEKQNDKLTTLNLRTFNLWLAAIYAVQGATIWLLSATKLFPVNTSYLTSDSVSSELAGSTIINTATRHLFDINLACLLTVLFFVGALAHLVAATVYRQQYEDGLKKKINLVRGIQFALSGGIILLALAVLSGVTDVSSLIMIFALKLVMDFALLTMEVYNRGKTKQNIVMTTIGVAAGIVPWVVLAVYIVGANIYGSGDIPAFVYMLYASVVAIFAAIRYNMYKQYKKQGNWKDFLYGESLYMILGLAAVMAVAWQIFAGALRP